MCCNHLTNVQCPVLFDPLGYPGDLIYLYEGQNGIYFNRSDVKDAMHAPQSVSWSECSGPVFADKGGPYSDGDYRYVDTFVLAKASLTPKPSLDPIQSVLPQVIEVTNRVLVANGDYDLEILTNGTLLSIQNMTWNGCLGFQEAPTTPIDIQLPDLQYQQAFADSGMTGYDGPGQGIMGVSPRVPPLLLAKLISLQVQHYERGLMWAETYQSGHMQPQFQPRSSYRHLQWVLGHIDAL
jgi:carboxypeptidase D